jgi:DeoR/GlpR family transcriptional regulator of sugar metabolism
MEDGDFTRERHRKIVDHINLNGRVKVEELSSRFNVTGMTIRRDLLALEKQGLLYRVHGGALKRQEKSIWQMSTLQDRLGQHEEEKERIAACVAPIYSKIWFNTPELCSGSNQTRLTKIGY